MRVPDARAVAERKWNSANLGRAFRKQRFLFQECRIPALFWRKRVWRAVYETFLDVGEVCLLLLLFGGFVYFVMSRW